MFNDDYRNEIQDADMNENEEENDDELLYDPDQDREERVAIRKEYRELHDDEKLLNPSTIDFGTLTQKVRSANQLFKRVRGPQEATLDSAFLVTASNLGAAKARQMRSDIGGFDIDDFVAKLITFMGGRRQAQIPEQDSDGFEIEEEGNAPLEWDSIGRKALAKSRRVPAMEFMLGPLSIEQKKRAITKRARLEKDAEEERRPEEVKQEDMKKTENETTKNVYALEKLMKRLKPINLFRVIINPESFSQSVENMFYLSFLIRDGKIDFYFEDDEPIIRACEQASGIDYENGVMKKQMVLELDMPTWQRAIEVFNIQRSLIPTRK